jgi:hypothetical protein
MKPWWEKKWGKDKICGITLTRLRPGSDKFGIPYSIYLPCGHGFYTQALLEWVINKETCPMCRKNFKFLEVVFKDFINN